MQTHQQWQTGDSIIGHSQWIEKDSNARMASCEIAHFRLLGVWQECCVAKLATIQSLFGLGGR